MTLHRRMTETQAALGATEGGHTDPGGPWRAERVKAPCPLLRTLTRMGGLVYTAVSDQEEIKLGINPNAQEIRKYVRVYFPSV